MIQTFHVVSRGKFVLTKIKSFKGRQHRLVVIKLLDLVVVQIEMSQVRQIL